MDTTFGLLLSILTGFVPMFLFAVLVYWADRYEKEPKRLLGGVFIWGAFVAAAGAFLLNTVFGLGVYLFTGSEVLTGLATGSLIAPVIEEILKALAVVLVFAAYRSEFDSVFDGIVYAAVAALGFAATENAFYIYTYGFQENGLSGIWEMVFIRVILVGWQHPFYTSFSGIGLAVARLNRNPGIKIAAPLIGLALSISAHAFHNTLSSFFSGTVGLAALSVVDWIGWLFMLIFAGWALHREQCWITDHLHEEVELGTITAQQYQTACSAWRQMAARISVLFTKKFAATARFYQLTAELAHKKQQLATVGDETGNYAIIERLREEIADLSAVV